MTSFSEAESPPATPPHSDPALNPQRVLTFLLVLATLHAKASQIAVGGEPVPEFQRDVFPILKKYCLDCHGSDVQEADLRLDQLSLDVVTDRRAAELWNEVRGEVSAARMPPEGERQLSEGEFQTLSTWLKFTVERAIVSRQKQHGRTVMRRLNRSEYQETMRDLLGMDMDYSRDLPPDAVSADGFRNDGLSLQMTAFQLETYLATARRAMDRLIVSGEKPQVFQHRFTESKIDGWLGQARRSNRLGRFEEFLAKMKDEYPEQGDFLVRVVVEAELKPDRGFPLLEVSVGYRPDTQILLREFDLIELDEAGEQAFEFRGRLEEFPLPVRGQGKYPGLVVRVRNRYSDGSPVPKLERDEKKKLIYPEEDHLPKILVKEVEFKGPVFDQWPPRSHRRILFDSPLREDNEAEYVREVLSRFMTRAFRRPVRENELRRMMVHYREIREGFPDLDETMRELLSLVLIQPGFLYRLEPEAGDKRPVTDWELASRLSYFFWETMPDQALFDLAAKGTLSAPDVLEQQVRRLLDDSRSRRMVERFVDGWLQVDRLQNIAVDAKRFPGVDESLKSDFRRQTYALFQHLLKDNLPVTDLIDPGFVMLNESLSRHYGVEGVRGDQPRPVAVDGAEWRGGILTHASVMLVNSTGEQSHPIRRAVWIRDRLLDDPPSPPPPDVPTLEQADKDFQKRSIVDQLRIHREKSACQSCHRDLDAWGLALENLDAVGRWRNEREGHAGKKHAVISRQLLPGGVEIEGVVGLKEHLLTVRRDDFCHSLVRRLATFATGRPLDLSDQPDVDRLVESLRSNEYRSRDLIIQLVLNPIFQTR